jgi:hypothetical protein
MAAFPPLVTGSTGAPTEIGAGDTIHPDNLPDPLIEFCNAYTGSEYSPSVTDGDDYRIVAFDDNGESVGVRLSQFLRSNFLTAENAGEGRTALGATTVGAAFLTLANPGAITFPRIDAANTVTARSAANYRTDLGGTTVGQAFFTLTNPGAITFPRIDAANTVTARSASNYRSDLGLGTSATVNTGTSGATIPLLNGNNTASGANTHSGVNTFSSAIVHTGIETLNLTGNTDNLAIAATTRVLRLTAGGAFNLTGITGGTNGRRLTVLNVDAADNITLIHDATSTAANRFVCAADISRVLRFHGGVELIYDGGNSRWWLIEP